LTTSFRETNTVFHFSLNACGWREDALSFVKWVAYDQKEPDETRAKTLNQRSF
jgi:hypothetical protein